MTCGDGRGYCLLGLDCTLDEEFLPDATGHCKGLQNAFTPSAYFSCCKYKNLTGQDNFVYTMVDPAVSTLVNSYTDSTTEQMHVENDHVDIPNHFKQSVKPDPNPEQDMKDANIIEEFHKHMEKVNLKNEEKDQKVDVSTSTVKSETQEHESIPSNNNHTEEESEEEEEDEEEEDEEEESDDIDEKSDNNDIKTIQLGKESLLLILG
ncbi:hypothetical protein WDU94_013049 [Cyamophila willieti]